MSAPLLDAMDELHCAPDLVRLIAMTTHNAPDDNQKAIGAGCEIIEQRFERAFELLRQAKEAPA